MLLLPAGTTLFFLRGAVLPASHNIRLVFCKPPGEIQGEYPAVENLSEFGVQVLETLINTYLLC